MEKYNTVPGRGLLTKTAISFRKDHMQGLGFSLDEVENTTINHTEIQNNIESLVGAVEIPLGLVGPLLYQNEGSTEEVFCLGATLEGALIASMNRGAKAISLSGGFSTKLIHQKMVRSPLFILSTVENAMHFEKWMKNKFDQIKEVSESYSNHANLVEIILHLDENNVHANFIYTTGDAAGQNMTTTCTWHAILWIVAEYETAGFEKITDFVLEGNGSSDKKVSEFLIRHGRGTKVIAHAVLKEDIIQKVLRTSSEQLLKFYGPSRKYAQLNGMVGYTINAANAIAAIFAATGQDLASIHESSVADLVLKKHPQGLEVSITLFSLVIGTLGGGTHLPKQQEALKLMKCAGSGKINRFASLIAGFVLGLELSTYSAMVSGEFAKAHEKLGRNKPIDWLQWKEVDESFIHKIVAKHFDQKILSIQLLKGEVENGILMNLSKRVNRKLIGFIPADIELENQSIPILLKSKATGIETIKGLHLMAASVDPELSDLITAHKDVLEYADSHLKELEVAQFIHENNLAIAPTYYGQICDKQREIFMLAQERLNPAEMRLMDAENKPELWTSSIVLASIEAIDRLHQKFRQVAEDEQPKSVNLFQFEKAMPLYSKLVEIAIKEDSQKSQFLNQLISSDNALKEHNELFKTVIHNDFNPRNVAVRTNDEICAYDWELAVINYPHRDIVEMLSFTLPANFSKEELMNYLKFHFELNSAENIDWKTWKQGYLLTLKEFILSRILFYCAAEVVMKLKFTDRIYQNSVRMYQFIEDL